MVEIAITSQNLLREHHAELLKYTLMYLQLRDNDDNFEDYMEAIHCIEQGIEDMKKLEKHFEEFDKTVVPTLTTEQKNKLIPYTPYEKEIW
jgi:CII-binding regulator of phage lambda lysogenization HflD